MLLALGAQDRRPVVGGGELLEAGEDLLGVEPVGDDHGRGAALLLGGGVVRGEREELLRDVEVDLHCPGSATLRSYALWRFTHNSELVPSARASFSAMLAVTERVPSTAPMTQPTGTSSVLANADMLTPIGTR